jgi:hypothetical protein
MITLGWSLCEGGGPTDGKRERAAKVAAFPPLVDK